jgi:hypothetical protein
MKDSLPFAATLAVFARHDRRGVHPRSAIE